MVSLSNFDAKVSDGVVFDSFSFLVDWGCSQRIIECLLDEYGAQNSSKAFGNIHQLHIRALVQNTIAVVLIWYCFLNPTSR
jgi:hypothetical protein